MMKLNEFKVGDMVRLKDHKSKEYTMLIKYVSNDVVVYQPYIRGQPDGKECTTTSFLYEYILCVPSKMLTFHFFKKGDGSIFSTLNKNYARFYKHIGCVHVHYPNDETDKFVIEVGG